MIALAGLNQACYFSRDELEKTIFIEDTAFPGLPIYSELGYNAFGAYFDSGVFRSSIDLPASVRVANGKTTFLFSGQKSSSWMSISFIIPQSNIQNYSELISISGTKYDLGDPKYQVIISNDFKDESAQILTGIFEITRIKNVIVDKKRVEVILAGRFNFQAMVNGRPVSVTEGRFDVGVDTGNFYYSL